MQHKELAAALGISGAMVSRLVKRSMPTDTVERAERWRSRHLEPARLKGTRIDTVQATARASMIELRPVAGVTTKSKLDRPQTGAADNAGGAFAVDRAMSMASLASVALSAGAFELAEIELRSALRAVPVARRSLVRMSADVFDALTADVARVFEVEAKAVDQAPATEMTDFEAEEMGRFWYDVACGDIVHTGGLGAR